MGNVRSAVPSRLGGQAAFFLSGNVFTLLIGLPLQIFVAQVLGADGLGVFSLIEGGVGLVAALLAFGLASTLVKFIPTHLERGEFACIRKLITSGLVILVVMGAAAYIVLWAIMPIVTSQWPVLSEHRLAVLIMGLLIPLSLIMFFLQQGLRGFQEIRYMVLGSSFMQLTVKATLTLILLTMGLQLMGYVWAVLISALCAVAWMALGLWRKLANLPVQEISGEAPTKAWLDYAKTMYGNSLLSIGGTYLDRFLLGAFAGAGAVGVLVVVKQLQQMPVIFLQMFLAVAAPMFSAAHAREDVEEREHIYHLTIDWVVRLSAPLFIFFFMFAEPMLSLYGKGFTGDGVQALWILLAGQAVNLAFGPLGSVMNMSGMERTMLRLSVYQAIILIVGMLVLLPFLGLVGAALAISASLISMNIAAYIVARRSLVLRWVDSRYLRWLAPLSVSLVAGGVMFTWGPDMPNAAMLFGYLVVLYAVFHGVSLAQGLHEDDRELLGHLRKRLGLAQDHAV